MATNCNKNILKTFFETGDAPTQRNFSDLIESNLNLNETNSICNPEGRLIIKNNNNALTAQQSNMMGMFVDSTSATWRGAVNLPAGGFSDGNISTSLNFNNTGQIKQTFFRHKSTQHDAKSLTIRMDGNLPSNSISGGFDPTLADTFSAIDMRNAILKQRYIIKTVGDTNWTDIGLSNNCILRYGSPQIGMGFTFNGSSITGSTGEAYINPRSSDFEIYANYQDDPLVDETTNNSLFVDSRVIYFRDNITSDVSMMLKNCYNNTGSVSAQTILLGDDISSASKKVRVGIGAMDVNCFNEVEGKLIDTLTVGGSISASEIIKGNELNLKKGLSATNSAGNNIFLSDLPTVDPGIAGALYRDGSGNLKVSI